MVIERGIGETRAALIDDGEIVEARIDLDGVTPAGSVIAARLVNNGTNGRNAVAVAEGGTEYLLPRGAPGAAQGQTLTIEVTRDPSPARSRGSVRSRVPSDKPLQTRRANRGTAAAVSVAGRCARRCRLGRFVDEARTGVVTFRGRRAANLRRPPR